VQCCVDKRTAHAQAQTGVCECEAHDVGMTAAAYRGKREPLPLASHNDADARITEGNGERSGVSWNRRANSGFL